MLRVVPPPCPRWGPYPGPRVLGSMGDASGDVLVTPGDTCQGRASDTCRGCVGDTRGDVPVMPTGDAPVTWRALGRAGLLGSAGRRGEGKETRRW